MHFQEVNADAFSKGPVWKYLGPPSPGALDTVLALGCVDSSRDSLDRSSKQIRRPWGLELSGRTWILSMAGVTSSSWDGCRCGGTVAPRGSPQHGAANGKVCAGTGQGVSWKLRVQSGLPRMISVPWKQELSREAVLYELSKHSIVWLDCTLL